MGWTRWDQGLGEAGEEEGGCGRGRAGAERGQGQRHVIEVRGRGRSCGRGWPGGDRVRA